jgi:hypothetical protein
MLRQDTEAGGGLMVAVSISSIRGATLFNSRVPASVVQTLRVVRVSSRTPKPRFQRQHGLTQGGARQAELSSCAGEAARAGDGYKRLQVT